MSEIIVIDTSVLVSALIGKHGASREILRKCLEGGFQPLISSALFHEYEDVIARDRIKKLCPLTGDDVRKLVDAIYSVCRWVPVYFLWRPNLSDENDNFLIELAIAGGCDTIVTNNTKDFQGAELNFSDLKILKPEQLLRGN